jgi:hypothetical protein
MYPPKKHTTLNPIGRLSMNSKCLDFYYFLLFLTCSFQGRNAFPLGFMFPRFPMCSTRVFPIALSFNPICFAQSPPLLTYIGAPKGEALHRIFYVSGASIVWTFCFAMGQSKWLIAKMKICTYEASPTDYYETELVPWINTIQEFHIRIVHIFNAMNPKIEKTWPRTEK